jgi:hypothetical protein
MNGSLSKYVLGEIIDDIKSTMKIDNMQLYETFCPILVPKEMGIS